jgi:hypothetical protein
LRSKSSALHRHDQNRRGPSTTLRFAQDDGFVEKYKKPELLTRRHPGGAKSPASTVWKVLALGRWFGQHQLFQAGIVVGQVGLAGGKFVEAQDVREQVGSVWAA